MINLKNFNDIRLVAFFCVIGLHSILSNIEFTRLIEHPAIFESVMSNKQFIMNAFYGNFFKSGTILFFIISGFLFQMQYQRIDSFLPFIKNKIKSLLKPYLIIFVLPTILILLIQPYVGEEKFDLTFFIFFKEFVKEIALSNYWFVPALFITLVINHFIKAEYVIKSLFIFIPIWLTSYLNIYLKLTLTSHTVWFVGFFFVFTIGRIICMKEVQISKLKIFNNKYNILLLMIFFYRISSLESMIILNYAHNVDYLNTLRIGNILFSVSFFYLLNIIFNKKNIKLPFEICTYFIYLVHPFVLRITGFFLFYYKFAFNYPSQILFNLIHLVVVLALCILLHNIFFNLKFKKKYIAEYVFKNKINASLPLYYSTFIFLKKQVIRSKG